MSRKRFGRRTPKKNKFSCWTQHYDSLESRQLLATDLFASVANPILSENGGATTVTVTLVNSVTAPSNFTIVGSDDTRVQYPGQIEVQPGQYEFEFEVNAIDNQLFDGNGPVDIQVIDPFQQSSTIGLWLVDDESSQGFTLDISRETIFEGPSTIAVMGTIDFDEPLEQTTTLSLFSSAPDRLDLPQEFVVNAGAISATFPINAFDNNLDDGDLLVDVVVLDEQLNAAFDSITVRDDDEVFEFSFELDRSSIDETEFAAIGTIELTQPAQQFLTFEVRTDDEFSSYVDRFVEIGFGESTASFEVYVFDDFIDNSERIVNITVSGDIGTPKTAQLEIIDDDFSELTLEVFSDIQFEGGADSGEISLSHPFDTDVDVVLSSSDPTEAIVDSPVTIPAGSTNVFFDFQMPFDNLVDGDRQVNLSGVLPNGSTSSDSITVVDSDFTRLSLVAQQFDLVEGGPAVPVELQLTTPIADDLLVELSVDVVDQVSFPMSVVIPAGESIASFDLLAIDDLLDEDDFQSVVLTIASDVQIDNPQEYFFVVDNDLPRTIDFFFQTNQLNEGESTTASLILNNGALPNDVVVSFAVYPTGVSPDTDLPQSVTIPAGSTQVDFQVTAIDDTLIESNFESVYFDITSEVEVNSPFGFLDIFDNDFGDLGLSAPTFVVSEDDGSLDLTVTLGGTLENDATVTLESTDIGEIAVPGVVVVPAGQSSVTVPMQIIQDNVVDSDAFVSIYASINEPLLSDFEFIDLEVLNSTESELSVTLSPNSIDENGGSTVATVTISAAYEYDQYFYFSPISSSPELDFGPGQVFIPAGQTSGQLIITAIDNDRVEGDLVSTIEVFGSDHPSLIVSLTVMEDDAFLPPTIDDISTPDFYEPTKLGQTTILSGIVSDLNPNDLLSVSVDWGDGTTSDASISEIDTLSDNFFAEHVYSNSGIYTATITVTDGLAQASQSVVLLVSGVSVDPEGQLLMIGTGEDDRFDLVRRDNGATVEVRWDFTGNRWGQRLFLSTDSLSDAEVYLGNGNDRLKTSGRLALPIFVSAGLGTDRIDTGAGDDTVVKLGGDAEIRTRGGNDSITTGSGNDNINSGGGNDMVNAGGGHDDISAGGGNDIVLGGSGADIINGGSGKDILIGGLGADAINGGGGSDLLIGGATSYDNNPLELTVIGNTWFSGSSYASRVDALIAGVGDDGSLRLVLGETIQEEAGVADVLTGGNSKDWFFADDDDEITDLLSGERNGDQS